MNVSTFLRNLFFRRPKQVSLMDHPTAVSSSAGFSPTSSRWRYRNHGEVHGAFGKPKGGPAARSLRRLLARAA